MSESYTRVVESGQVSDEGSVAAKVAGKPVLICRSGGVLYAVANRCSHAEEPLACGRIRRGWIACPVHGARFDLETGEPINPPATSPIATYPVREVDGWVEVAVE
ncbi:MAG: Rieske 2Fe-2S domain-containing protein [Novosphingobium sp.]|nr:Rieske 2Fe-2S domain-containing protein [Novosphingobium sp.]